MKRDKAALVQAWLKRSAKDIGAAKLLSNHDEQTETALFHLQQSVEKSLKSYLIWKEASFPHIHDIECLLDMVVKLDATFEQWERLGDISIFAVAGRYPESDEWIGDCYPHDWLDDVQALYLFVCEKVEER